MESREAVHFLPIPEKVQLPPVSALMNVVEGLLPRVTGETGWTRPLWSPSDPPCTVWWWCAEWTAGRGLDLSGVAFWGEILLARPALHHGAQLRIIGGMAALWVQSQQVLILAPVASLISLGQRREPGAEEKGRGHGISGAGASWVWPLPCLFLQQWDRVGGAWSSPEVIPPAGAASRWVGGEGRVGSLWGVSPAPPPPLAVPSALSHGVGAAAGEPGHHASLRGPDGAGEARGADPRPHQ